MTESAGAGRDGEGGDVAVPWKVVGVFAAGCSRRVGRDGGGIG